MKKRSPYWWLFISVSGVLCISILALALSMVLLSTQPWAWWVYWPSVSVGMLCISLMWILTSVWSLHRGIGFIRHFRNTERRPRVWPLLVAIPLTTVNALGLYDAFISPEYSYRRNEKAIVKHAISPAEAEKLRGYNDKALEAKALGNIEMMREFNAKLRPYFKTISSGRSYRRSMKDLNKAQTNLDRFRALGDAAVWSYNVGRTEDAQRFADELNSILPQYEKKYGYANAKHDLYTVYGLLALQNGDVEKAKACLLEAGKSKGSATLNSFGPSMSLAGDLIRIGETAAVLNYFEQCGRFWKHGSDRLALWSEQVKAAELPDFGSRHSS